MINKGLWKKTKRIIILPNRCQIDSKLVFKKKRDGQYMSRLVTQRYIQIPRVDFTNKYSPVVTDSTLRVSNLSSIFTFLFMITSHGITTKEFDYVVLYLRAPVEREI